MEKVVVGAGLEVDWEDDKDEHTNDTSARILSGMKKEEGIEGADFSLCVALCDNAATIFQTGWSLRIVGASQMLHEL